MRERSPTISAPVREFPPWQPAFSRGSRLALRRGMLIPQAEALSVHDLISPTAHGIASRVLARSGGGNVTLFAFDAGQGLTEHTTAFDALALVLEGAITFTIGGTAVEATEDAIVRLPANVPHAVDAPAASRMLLIMLKDVKA